MSLRWRWCLVVVFAATVLSGFIPQAVLTGSHVPASAIPAITENAPTFPSGCAGTACGVSDRHAGWDDGVIARVGDGCRAEAIGQVEGRRADARSACGSLRDRVGRYLAGE